jgi:hypothetical protein
MVRRWIPLLAFTALLLLAAAACSESLNPQPLPPNHEEDKGAGGTPSGGEQGGSSSGDSPAPMDPGEADAGLRDGSVDDAGDAGGDT